MAWMYRSIPFEKNSNSILCLTDNPESNKTGRELEILLNSKIAFHQIDQKLMELALEKHYRKSNILDNNNSFLQQSDIQALILEAKRLKSSDIHIEIAENHARIRFRIDGKLIERYRFEKRSYPALVNKLKIKSNLNISEKRLPQDGRFQIVLKNSSIDIRVSITPTILGEKIVLRLLNKEGDKFKIDSIGLDDDQLLILKKSLKKQNGIILISGPTGSGKTSTLYACLNELNSDESNILTIEDPVEYTLNGINQVQLKESIGLGFAKALKSFLRQDPDIIMVGEIRDKETANMAVRASLTGHLVLSTIHTNSAWSTVSRLRDMGIPVFLIAGTLRLSIAQRLVRVLCNKCKSENSIDKNELPANWLKYLESTKTYSPIGCNHCYQTGYKGRQALFEILSINGSLRNHIKNENDNESEILKETNTTSLAENALKLVKSGKTSLEEIYPLIIEK
ncbi:type II/IV secretion system protein [Hyphobacterium sp. CCMP332]|nr:type II/IV secretion system protein [Hyphobacterium sp. CCMP332]